MRLVWLVKLWRVPGLVTLWDDSFREIDCGGSLVESLSGTTVNYWIEEADCGGSLVESLWDDSR